MPRPLRIEFDGALHHVMSRGNRGQTIFANDADRRLYLELLADAVARNGWLCHAYCLMGNHVHLLIETPKANLGSGMQQLNGRFTQRLNHRNETYGHVFQGRAT